MLVIPGGARGPLQICAARLDRVPQPLVNAEVRAASDGTASHDGTALSATSAAREGISLDAIRVDSDHCVGHIGVGGGC